MSHYDGRRRCLFHSYSLGLLFVATASLCSVYLPDMYIGLARSHSVASSLTCARCLPADVGLGVAIVIYDSDVAIVEVEDGWMGWRVLIHLCILHFTCLLGRLRAYRISVRSQIVYNGLLPHRVDNGGKRIRLSR